MGAQENEAVLRRWIESLNRGAPALEETFAPDARVTIIGQDSVTDPASFLAFLGGLGAAFPDMRFEPHDFTATEDAVAFRWEARGTHKGEFLGIPPTGQRVVIAGVSLDHLRDGRIVRRYEIPDNLGLLQQLGAFPTTGIPLA